MILLLALMTCSTETVCYKERKKKKTLLKVMTDQSEASIRITHEIIKTNISLLPSCRPDGCTNLRTEPYEINEGILALQASWEHDVHAALF